MKKALLITDVTNCFGPNGDLPVPSSFSNAAQTIRNINIMFEYAESHLDEFALVVLSRDWHDNESPHFDKWPKHGVKFTWGSEFYPDLKIQSGKIPVAIVSKGIGKVDGYSPFDPVTTVNIILIMPDGNAYIWEGDLDSLAKEFRVGVFLNSGWAENYCVEAGSLAAIEKGYEVHLLTDATDGVNVPTDPDNHIEKSEKRMREAGVIFTTTKEEVLNG